MAGRQTDDPITHRDGNKNQCDGKRPPLESLKDQTDYKEDCGKLTVEQMTSMKDQVDESIKEDEQHVAKDKEHVKDDEEHVKDDKEYLQGELARLEKKKKHSKELADKIRDATSK